MYRPRTVSAVSPNSVSVTWPLASVLPLAGSMLPNSDTSALACGAPSLPMTLMTALSTGPLPLVGVTPVTSAGWRSDGSIRFSGWSRSTSKRPWPCWCRAAAFCSVMRATSTPWPPPMPSASVPSTFLGPILSITSMSLLLRSACSSTSNCSGWKPCACKPSVVWRGAMTNCFLRPPMLRPGLSARRPLPGLPVSAGSSSLVDVVRSGGVAPPLGFLGMMFLSKGIERAV